MKPPKLPALVIVIHVLSLPLAFFIGENFGQADRFESRMPTLMPMLIGLFGLAPFVFLFGWMTRIAPRASRVLLAIHAVVFVLILNPGTVGFAMRLPFPLFFVALYLPQREARRDFVAWLQAENFAHLPNPPAAVLDKLGSRRGCSNRTRRRNSPRCAITPGTSISCIPSSRRSRRRRAWVG